MVLKKLVRSLCPPAVVIDEAKNGLESFTQASETRYDVVLMDVQMPVMGGIEATQKIRQTPTSKSRESPIIGVTASATMLDREKCLDVGMNDVLCKPFTTEQFKVSLSQWAPSVLKPELLEMN
jgi:CheY-like chemotaxis protein